VPLPTQTAPTQPLPTQTIPTQTVPTAGVPGGGATQPTVDLPTQPPSVAVPTAVVVPPNPPARLDPISDDGAGAYHYSTYAASAQHATLSSGLNSGLWSEDTGTDLYPGASGIDPVLY